MSGRPAYLDKSIDAARVGAAVEHLIAASCILASGAVLNVSTSLVDDEGVDLVFHRRGRPATLAVQVKARTTDTTTVQRGRFTAAVRAATFMPRSDLYMLFVVVRRQLATLEQVFFIPSGDYDRLARAGKGTRRISASLKPDTQDQWRPFRMSFAELPGAIVARLKDLETARGG